MKAMFQNHPARMIVSCVLMSLMMLGCGDSLPGGTNQEPPCNLLLITVDTTRADYIHCYGKEDIDTPNMDRLAAEGVQFMRNIAPSQCTNPSHASIMTGLYPARHGVYNNQTRLSEEALTLAEQLKEEGYQTLAAVSAHHLNPKNSQFGQGFDVFLTCEGNQINARQRNEELYPELDKMVQSPFFAWVHYFDPHGAYRPPAPYNLYYAAGDRYEPIPTSDRMDIAPETKQSGQVDPDDEIRQYKGEITFMDKQIGDLLTWLEEKRVLDNTLVVLVGDHGESMVEKGIYFCHAGMYNQVLHVPFIMRMPSRIPEGLKVESLTSSVDIAPTILELLNIKSDEQQIDGSSLSPTFTDPNTQIHTHLFSEAVGGVIRSVYDHEYKYMKPYPWDWAVTEDHLYKPFEDYAEEQDIKMQDPERAKQMETLLDTWLEAASKQRFSSEERQALDPETEKALKALGYMN